MKFSDGQIFLELTELGIKERTTVSYTLRMIKILMLQNKNRQTSIVTKLYEVF